MAEVITNTGLQLPDDFTEEQFFEAGRFLARIEQGMQWAIGDWYNAIPWGDKEKACEEAGLNPKTAKQYAWVCGYFQNVSARRQSDVIKFTHHKVLALDALTPDQRTFLLERADANGWSSARLTAERDKLLGKPPKVPLLTFDSKVERVLETLPKSVSTKTRKEVNRVMDDLKHDFEKEVHYVVQERLKDQRERIHAIEQEAQQERDRARDLRLNLDGLMSEEEYRLIRGCLHPDRAPADRREQFSRAFEIFNRLERTVNRDMPIATRRARGWA